MGAIAADARTKNSYIIRLQHIAAALALTSWHDAVAILQRYFWKPSIFSEPGHRVWAEFSAPQSYAGI